MRIPQQIVVLLAFSCLSMFTQGQNEDSLVIRQIYDEILSNGECYSNLEVLCKDIGCRLSGSPEADRAIAWGEELLKSYGFENVTKQPVEVPHWTRGDIESGHYTSNGTDYPVRLCALGGSVGSNGSITAPVIEVKRLEELADLGREQIEGRIVFFNRPMDPVLINTGAAYGGAYDQRGKGASEAAKYGAVGTIIRSLTHALDTFPHTGGMRYEPEIKKIPAAALCTVDARALSQQIKSDPDLTFTLELDCQKFDDKVQYNVMGEIPGSTLPEQIIVVGGHLDSWDIGEGAHDDGAGIVQTIEVLRALKALNIELKRTLRVVLYINEENGNNGGKTYANESKEDDVYHFAAIESDAGGFSPRGFRFDGSDEQYEIFKTFEGLLEPYNLHVFRRGHTGVDIGPLKDGRVALFGLVPDGQRYFDYHHSNNDIFENVNRRELELGAASITCLVYLIDKHL